MEVVGDLGEDASPVDGVYGTEVMRLRENGVGEEGFNDVL